MMTIKDKIDAAMEAVWALVRSGPNFDGRDKDVRAAIEAVAKAERERCDEIVGEEQLYPSDSDCHEVNTRLHRIMDKINGGGRCPTSGSGIPESGVAPRDAGHPHQLEGIARWG